VINNNIRNCGNIVVVPEELHVATRMLLVFDEKVR